jgi:orotidine-5'-phosphate decarboxylase
VAAAFDSRGSGAVVNNSRGILYAHSRAPYAGRYGDARWQDAVAAATDDMIDQLRSVTAASNR